MFQTCSSACCTVNCRSVSDHTSRIVGRVARRFVNPIIKSGFHMPDEQAFSLLAKTENWRRKIFLSKVVRCAHVGRFYHCMKTIKDKEYFAKAIQEMNQDLAYFEEKYKGCFIETPHIGYGNRKTNCFVGGRNK